MRTSRIADKSTWYLGWAMLLRNQLNLALAFKRDDGPTYLTCIAMGASINPFRHILEGLEGSFLAVTVALILYDPLSDA